MLSTENDESKAGLSAEDAAEMATFGISCTLVAQFHFGGYRYSNLRDALAQAKRVAKSS